MPKTLVVPDIHEQAIRFRREVEPLFGDFDQVVFLGDWFDTFKNHDPEGMCNAINRYIFNDKFVFLMGNHDAHYRWPREEFLCSGFQRETAEVIKSNLTPAEWQRFKISHQVGPYLLSHAGYHERTLKYRSSESDALASADQGAFHPIFGVGQARGGRQAFGGPLWLDFNWEFEHIANLPQIVGHTVQRGGPAHKSGSICLDTALRHLAVIDTTGPDAAVVDIIKLSPKGGG